MVAMSLCPSRRLVINFSINYNVYRSRSPILSLLTDFLKNKSVFFIIIFPFSTQKYILHATLSISYLIQMGLHRSLVCLCTLLVNKEICVSTACSLRIDCYCKLCRRPKNKKQNMSKYLSQPMY